MVLRDGFDEACANSIEPTITDVADIGRALFGQKKADDRRAHAVESSVFSTRAKNGFVCAGDRSEEAGRGVSVAGKYLLAD